MVEIKQCSLTVELPYSRGHALQVSGAIPCKITQNHRMEVNNWFYMMLDSKGHNFWRRGFQHIVGAKKHDVLTV